MEVQSPAPHSGKNGDLTGSGLREAVIGILYPEHDNRCKHYLGRSHIAQVLTLKLRRLFHYICLTHWEKEVSRGLNTR
jgi:hypothetical protein